MKMTHKDMVCNVCCKSEQIAGVAASPLGPISFCYCVPCLQVGAQPEFMLEYLYSEVGIEGEGLADWVSEVVTFKENEYWTWDRWKTWRKDNPPKDEAAPE